MNSDLVCPFCDFDNSSRSLMMDNLIECEGCGAYFEIEDRLVPKQIKTKPKRKIEENLEDGF